MSEITIKDIYEFLYTYLSDKNYDHLLAVIESEQDFYLVFPLVESINDITKITIFRREGRFAIQFIPEHVDIRADSDTIAPDVVVFVNK